MNPYLRISMLSLSSFLLSSSATYADTKEYITQQSALSCIQTNKDMNLASQQMIKTETNKSNLKNKIDDLHNEIQKHRKLIGKLDQQNIQSNNDNYNQLVNQFDELVEERKQAIKIYNEQDILHSTQYDSVVRLETRFSTNCLSNIIIKEAIHKTVCKDETVRWCGLFTF